MKEYFKSLPVELKLLIFALLTACAAYFGVTADFSDDDAPPETVEVLSE